MAMERKRLTENRLGCQRGGARNRKRILGGQTVSKNNDKKKIKYKQRAQMPLISINDDISFEDYNRRGESRGGKRSLRMKKKQ